MLPVGTVLVTCGRHGNLLMYGRHGTSAPNIQNMLPVGTVLVSYVW